MPHTPDPRDIALEAARERLAEVLADYPQVIFGRAHQRIADTLRLIDQALTAPQATTRRVEKQTPECEIDKRELNLLLGALRFYQVGVLGSWLSAEKQAACFDKRGRVKPDKAAPEAQEIYYETIRSGLESGEPDMTVPEIDALADRIRAAAKVSA